MGLMIFVLILTLLVLAVVVPGVRVARRPLEPWTRVLAVVMVLLALTLLVFLFVEDDYTADGRSNWTAYDVEYPTIPTVVGLVLGAAWLVRHAGSRAAALAAPLLALGSGFAAFVCFLFTTN
jgi:hypothetical protein